MQQHHGQSSKAPKAFEMHLALIANLFIQFAAPLIHEPLSALQCRAYPKQSGGANSLWQFDHIYVDMIPISIFRSYTVSWCSVLDRIAFSPLRTT
jgi:hypothetical protein